MLKTRNIFIDTQAFVANNFFESENLKRLAEFGNKGIIQIYLTEITINEIKSNIREDLLNAQDEINRFKKTIAGKSRILKNVDEYKQYIDLPKLDLQVDFNKLILELDEFIKYGKIHIIPYNKANLKEIITKYFNKEKPFGLGKKKYEFPDAIVLSAIENWCIKNQCLIYVLGNDMDMKEYVSDKLLPVNKLRSILNTLNEFENARAKWLTKIFKESKERIQVEIEKRFKDKIEDEWFSRIKVNEIEIEDFTFFDDESIVVDNIDSNETIFQLELDIYFSATIEYEHIYESSLDYDTGKDKWSFNESRERSISMSKTIVAEIAFETEYKQNVKNDQSAYSIYCSFVTIPDEDEFLDAVRDE
ncbi:MAG TPA: PIN domain-containing protein [Prolixibacteraceae bacterium]|nr:PIN domain-containing protein [Prolixibacteraceae bacterium]